MMMRYLEGLASGARLLGVLPNHDEFARMLPLGAVVRCAPDGSDLEAALARDAADPHAEDRHRAAQRRGVAAHGWGRRAPANHRPPAPPLAGASAPGRG